MFIFANAVRKMCQSQLQCKVIACVYKILERQIMQNFILHSHGRVNLRWIIWLAIEKLTMTTSVPSLQAGAAGLLFVWRIFVAQK